MRRLLKTINKNINKREKGEIEDGYISLIHRNNDAFRQDKSGQESSKATEIKASAELFTRA